jgi:hypothetical protein
MGFVEKLGLYSADKKKVVSARVSEIVVEALNDAEKDVAPLGYKFSISNIIEKALNDTLEELKIITGIDYYELTNWTNRMKNTESLHSSDKYDFDHHNEMFKDLIIATQGLEGQSDFDARLKEYQHDVVRYWNNDLKGQGCETVVDKDSLVVMYQPNAYDTKTKAPEYTVQTLSKLLKKSTDKVIDILNNAGVTGKNADSRISTDDRQKLMNSLSRSSSNDINIKFK